MYKRTFKYTDYDGNPREEDVYFNLSEAELAEMMFSADGGLDQAIKRIVAAQNTKEIISTWKMILLKSYGEKSPDGKRFIKSKELSDAFSQTEMYNQLFMELTFDAEKAAEFMDKVTPPKKDGKGKLVNLKDAAPRPGESPQDTIRRVTGEIEGEVHSGEFSQ